MLPTLVPILIAKSVSHFHLVHACLLFGPIDFPRNKVIHTLSVFDNQLMNSDHYIITTSSISSVRAHDFQVYHNVC